jgi:hypothetical protein
MKLINKNSYRPLKNINFFHELEPVIWTNFHVYHLDYTSTDWELKFKNCPGL